jgi:hypothetical protein
MDFNRDFNFGNRNGNSNGNGNTNDDRIIIEKHYLPVSLYRELYYNYNNNNYVSNPYVATQQPNSQIPILRNNFSPFNNNIFNNNNPFNTTNHTSNIFPLVNERINNIFQPLQRVNTQIQEPTIPTEILSNPVEVPSVTLFSNFRHNIFNDLINRHIPFNIQVNDIIADNDLNNGYQNESLVGIPLSNINIITNVMRFCDIVNDNNADTCSICQVPFNSNEICRIINNCKHIFHINCIDNWLHDHSTCPFCRYNLLTNNTPDSTSDNIQDNLNYTTNENEEDYDDEDYNEEDYNEEDYDEEDYDEEYTEENNENNENQNNSETQDIPQVFSGVFTTSSNTSGIFNTEPILTDINNFVNITTPFINSFISGSTSNASVRLNSNNINNQINRQINNFVNNLNPLLQSFSNFGGNRY